MDSRRKYLMPLTAFRAIWTNAFRFIRIAIYPAAAGASIIALVVASSTTVLAQTPDDSLKIYTIELEKAFPFQQPTKGYGIYLGSGLILTTSHFVGRWHYLASYGISLPGEKLPAYIMKNNDAQQSNLALLSVDETRLPLQLRLRRNPLCTDPLKSGDVVVVVNLERVTRDLVVPAEDIPRNLRQNNATFVDEIHAPGSGIFYARTKCFAGIVETLLMKYTARKEGERSMPQTAGFKTRFIPARVIAAFLPEHPKK